MNILLLCLVSRVVAELQTIHKIYISHKSKVDGIKPTFEGMAFEEPLVHSTLNSVPSDVKSLATEKYSVSNPNRYSKSIKLAKRTPISIQSKREIDSVTPVIQYNHKYLPSKIKANIMYEQLKSAMHYRPTENEVVSGYYDGIGYLNDQDDVRSSSRSVYDNYPYLYHNPYEYEQTKSDVEMQKAKDKRYATDPTRVIPIHEDLSHDVVPDAYLYTLTTDNPMNGHDPFFKFVLNDYFDKNSDEDHLTFKGLNWGREFDHESALTDHPPAEVFRKNRRLDYDNFYIPKHNHYNIESTQGADVTEDTNIKKYDFDKHEKGNGEKTYDKSAYQKQGNQYTGFKDFVDAFANKFGSEDQKKDSKFVLKRDQDRGEKRKGFRRVYHKDEYQEDNEFYDNNNHKTQLEENGNASAHAGGSEGLLKSQAVAAIRNDAKAYNKIHDQEEDNYEKNRKGYEKMQGLDGNFNRYKDIAKFAAQSNNADYSDHFRI